MYSRALARGKMECSRRIGPDRDRVCSTSVPARSMCAAVVLVVADAVAFTLKQLCCHDCITRRGSLQQCITSLVASLLCLATAFFPSLALSPPALRRRSRRRRRYRCGWRWAFHLLGKCLSPVNIDVAGAGVTASAQWVVQCFMSLFAPVPVRLLLVLLLRVTWYSLLLP